MRGQLAFNKLCFYYKFLNAFRKTFSRKSRAMRRRLSLVFIVIAVLGLLLFLFWYNNMRSEETKIGDYIPIAQILDDANRSDLRAHFFLVKFWGSWCAPCRNEHPVWISLYREYKSKVVEPPILAVVGVALEADSAAWRMAMEKDQLPWEAHIIQDRNMKTGWAGELNVSRLPENVLLDSSGTVFGRNMSADEVDRFLRHRLTE